MGINKTEFVKSAVAVRDYPEETDIEFAFIGRSNVGKSSLINSLTNRRNLARTSKTPGRTQLINYFKVNDDFYFVDLPGYGFAKVPVAVKKNWGNLISDYLNSDRKKIVFLLLDIRRIPSAEDMEMLEWLEHYNIDHYVIFTKIDKFSNNQKFKQLKEIKKKLEFDNNDVFFYSALKDTGREALEEFIFEERKEAGKTGFKSVY